MIPPKDKNLANKNMQIPQFCDKYDLIYRQLNTWNLHLMQPPSSIIFAAVTRQPGMFVYEITKRMRFEFPGKVMKFATFQFFSAAESLSAVLMESYLGCWWVCKLCCLRKKGGGIALSLCGRVDPLYILS